MWPAAVFVSEEERMSMFMHVRSERMELACTCTYRNVSLQSDNTNPIMSPTYMNVSVNISSVGVT